MLYSQSMDDMQQFTGCQTLRQSMEITPFLTTIKDKDAVMSPPRNMPKNIQIKMNSFSKYTSNALGKSLVKKGIETPQMTTIEESEVNNEFAAHDIENEAEEVYNHLTVDDTNDSK